MLGSSRAVLLVLSAFYVGLGFTLPTHVHLRREAAVLVRQDATQQPITVQTQDMVQTPQGPMMETCTITLTPVTGQNGEPLFEETKQCTLVAATNAATSSASSATDSASAASSAASSSASASATDAAASSSATSGTASASASASASGSASSDSAGATSSVATTSASASGSPAPSVIVNSVVSIPIASVSGFIPPSATPTSSAPSLSVSASGSGSASATASPSVSSSAASSSDTSSSAPTSSASSSDSTAAPGSTPAPGANAAGSPNSPSDTTTSGDPTGTSQSDTAASSAPPFQIPGKQLSVLPIGLAVFAGISVIALIVVGLVTYERTKYRRAFRQRKLAESGASMGYGGMAQVA